MVTNRCRHYPYDLNHYFDLLFLFLRKSKEGFSQKVPLSGQEERVGNVTSSKVQFLPSSLKFRTCADLDSEPLDSLSGIQSQPPGQDRPLVSPSKPSDLASFYTKCSHPRGDKCPKYRAPNTCHAFTQPPVACCQVVNNQFSAGAILYL